MQAIEPDAVVTQAHRSLCPFEQATMACSSQTGVALEQPLPETCADAGVADPRIIGAT